jgi:hypothetical protein
MTAAARAAALLRQLDASRQRDDLSETTRVGCTEPGCRSELICVTRHVDNLGTWRCLEHRHDQPMTAVDLRHTTRQTTTERLTDDE